MKNKRTIIGLMSALGLVLLLCSACVPSLAPTSIEKATIASSATYQIELRKQTSSVENSPPTETVSPAAVEGPLLLIQTDFDAYHYIAPKSGLMIPFDPPFSGTNFEFNANLSPSGKLLFFYLDQDISVILNLLTNEVDYTYANYTPTVFNPHQAASASRADFTQEEYSNDHLFEAITQAYHQSIQITQWYQNDRYHLSVDDTDPISTHLFLNDHQSGIQQQLEDQPGLVKSVHVNPTGEKILVIKNRVFEPKASHEDRFYIIDLFNHTTQPVPLPQDIDNPAVTWFSEDTLQIIHQMKLTGGWKFSFIDTTTMISTQVISGDFSDLRRFGEHLVVFQRDTESHQTTLEIFGLDGGRIASQNIAGTCYYQTAFNNHLILNRAQDSLIVDQDLNVKPLGDPLLIFSPAPDQHVIMVVDRNGQSFLLDSKLSFQTMLHLEGTPMEIRWLPDASAFLYRPRGQLLYYDLDQAESRLLLESDIFSDYININAVWVNLN